MVVFDIHIGEGQASWERQKVIPESIDDACASSFGSAIDVQQSKSAKAAASWQVQSLANAMRSSFFLILSKQLSLGSRAGLDTIHPHSHRCFGNGLLQRLAFVS